MMQTEAPVRTGKVTAVCYSTELVNDVGKMPHDEAQVTRLGIPGDKHYGETRVSSTQGVIPNDRPITVVGVEAARNACEKLGADPVPPGGLGENILVEGLGDLSDLVEGDELHVVSPDATEPSVMLRVSLQNPPCSNLQIYHKQMVKELYGKRGVVCTVLQEGAVRMGDKMVLVRQ